MSENRIFISGASGVGKTHLANWIAKEYGIPFISTSAKVAWKKMGFRDHAHALKTSMLHPEIGWEYQIMVLDDRVEALQGLSSFVTDRSPFDNLAYLLLQSGYLLSPDQLTEYVRLCSESTKLGNKLIHIKYSDDIPLEDDGFRIQNPTYQKMVDTVIYMTIERGMLDHDLSVTLLDYWDFDDRKYKMNIWLKR